MTSVDPSSLLTGRKRALAGAALAAANLMVVLDMTIANVSVPHISGNLGISASQGTWVITSYAVAEAICLPLTGWLSQRIGTVRLFILSVLGFGLFSVLCGLSPTLGMLVVARIGQGVCGGPLVPLTQTLLMRIYPPEKRPQAMGIWAITTLTGPALGPIMGGFISDNWSWHWIFFINMPIVAFCAGISYAMLRPAETPVVRIPIDKIGIALLVLWIGCLQIMLDIGREHDWFADPFVLGLGIAAAIFFVLFIVWELTDEHPVVDLRIFRYRGFTLSAFTLALGFGAYFAGIVVIPQWMQLSLGYTATQAGFATAFTAIAALFVARFPPLLMGKMDARFVLSFGLIWLGGSTLLRTNWTSGADFWSLAMPQFIMGIGMPFFFVTVTSISLSSVPPQMVTSAASLQNLLRTIALAFSTSVVVTFWNDQARMFGSDLSGNVNPDSMTATLTERGFSSEQIRTMIAQLVDKEALTLATDKVFLVTGTLLIAITALVWLAPRPKISGPPRGGH